MRQKQYSRSAILAWTLSAICILAAIFLLAIWLMQLTGLPSLFDLSQAIFWQLVMTVVFSIFSKQSIVKVERCMHRHHKYVCLLDAHAANIPVKRLIDVDSMGS